MTTRRDNHRLRFKLSRCNRVLIACRLLLFSDANNAINRFRTTNLYLLRFSILRYYFVSGSNRKICTFFFFPMASMRKHSISCRQYLLYRCGETHSTFVQYSHTPCVRACQFVGPSLDETYFYYRRYRE